MRLSTERILTTHVGSMPRPQDVVDILFAEDKDELTTQQRTQYDTHEEPLEVAEQQCLKQWRQRQRLRGRVPKTRKVRFWVRATVMLDSARQAADARRRKCTLQAYETKLAYTAGQLGKGHFY